MTRKELSQIFYLNKELRMWQEESQRLEEKIGSSGKWLDGMPHSTEISDPTGNLASEIASCRLMVSCKAVEIQVQRNRIINYINEIQDSLLRQIVFYRCVSCMEWRQVASTIGGSNTADNTKKLFYRHFGGEE